MANIADTLIAVPTTLSRAADALAANLIPAADNLLNGLAAIMLVIIGLRMMLEKNQHDQAIIGDALKLLLLLGVAKALLSNHSYLMGLLNQSADYLCRQMGIDPDNIYSSMFKMIFYDPMKAMFDSMPDIWPSGSPESDGWWDTIVNGVTKLDIAAQNLISWAMTMLVWFVMGWTTMAIAVAALVMITFPEILLSFVASIGVICIPFLIVPKLDKIFWSWLEGLVYAFMCKLTVVGSTSLIAALFTANVGEMVIPIGGINMPNLGTMFGVVINIVIAYSLIKLSYRLAGVLAGARLSLEPEITMPKVGKT